MASSVRELKDCVKKTLPKFMKVLPAKGEHTIWLPRDKALVFERVKLHQNDRHFLIMDYDVKHGNIAVDHTHYDIEPNFISYNMKTSSHQAYWFLKDPVHCQEESKQRKPHQYLRAIEAAYDEKYQGDNNFSRYVSRNPFFIGTDTDWRHNERYNLKELASIVQLNQYRVRTGGKAVPVNQQNGKESRNISVFNELRLWAYKQDTEHFSFPDWQQRCLTQAIEYNLFKKPMNINEINSIARSVAQYTYIRHFSESFSDYVGRTHTSEIQAIRGAIGGKKSKRKPMVDSEASKKPWEPMGISRATYYRNKNNA